MAKISKLEKEIMLLKSRNEEMEKSFTDKLKQEQERTHSVLSSFKPISQRIMSVGKR